MRVALSLADLAVGRRDLVVQAGQLSFIPTMGALHDGHMALVDAARVTGAAVAVSIFVNPTQFAVNDDFATYPRDEAGDLRMLERAGCDLVWLPDAELMYPPDDATRIDVAGPALRWEGDVRPGHFRGVATVCAKLFGQIRPTAAIFGEKDWQQLCVVRRMVANLHLPLEIVGVPTVREPDGLAMSSRNRRLSATERKLAGRLPATLQRCVEQLPERGVVALSAAADELIDAGFRIDYLALVDGDTLEPLAAPRDGARIIAAARLGSVRLLDNLRVGKEVAGLS